MHRLGVGELGGRGVLLILPAKLLADPQCRTNCALVGEDDLNQRAAVFRVFKLEALQAGSGGGRGGSGLDHLARMVVLGGEDR